MVAEKRKRSKKIEKPKVVDLNVSKKPYKMTFKSKKLTILVLLLGLIAITIGGVLFVGATAGWFQSKVSFDKEYLCGNECDREFISLSADEYNELVQQKKSFVMLVDQSGCTTADRLREFALDWANTYGAKVFRISFGAMKSTSLYDSVKYYPSVVVFSKGKPVKWLRADSNEDSDAYNEYNAFNAWISKIVE